MPTKRYSKDRATCQVTFTLPKEIGADRAVVTGDFDDWSRESHPMKRAKDGSFKLAMKLPAGRSYRYRFFLDGERWENDWSAERYEANEHGSEDSVLDL